MRVFRGIIAVWLLVVAFAFYGWGSNLVNVLSMDNIDYSDGTTVAQLVGIPFAPLGAIMGYIK